MSKFTSFIAAFLLSLEAWAGLLPSSTLPSQGVPEHRYTMMNAQGYYANATTSPTRQSDQQAQFAFYASGVADAYYIYNVTRQQWLSYASQASYAPQTGFVQFSSERTEGAYFRLKSLGGEAYEISPYLSGGNPAALYLNWYKGVGGSNPENGSVTLGLWSDGGAKDKGSHWTLTEVGAKHAYTLFSDGMPSDAVVTIAGREFRGLNAQGDQSIELERLKPEDVEVKVGGGYLSSVSVDNANHQVDITFIQFFIPTQSVTSATQYPYVLKMPAAYLRHYNRNLVHTTKRSEATRFIFVEASQGQYYIYDPAASRYLYYTEASLGTNVKSSSESRVRLTSSVDTATPWRFLLLSDHAVAIVPGSVAQPTGASPAWNFTGGIAQNCVLNLWRADDTNSAWEVQDPSAGSLACATLLYAQPGAEYIHKLVALPGETVTGADLGTLSSTLSLKDDRQECGNQYRYIYGTAPTEEGEYTYTVQVSDAEGETRSAKVRLVVSHSLQSPTPMMAWLTWNWFARSISHDKMVEIARGMQRHGLVEAGFNTIVLDDAWAQPTRDKAALTYDPVKFPQGITGLKKALRAIHPAFKVGIYSDAGSMTCENYQPGSYQFEESHVALFDQWGVDMLKYDYCNSQASTKVSYSAMGRVIDRLNEQRKAQGITPFVFNICEWGKTQPWLWGAEAGGSSWRTTSDAREDWVGNNGRPGVLAGVDETRRLWMYAGVNRFNDLDMMCIGLHGLGGPSNNIASHMSNGGTITGLTDEQARTQMSLWCMLASPLALTCDLREIPQGEANSGVSMPRPLITAEDIRTLTNTDLLALNQDALGQQAEYMESLSTGRTNYATSGYDVYVKDLTGGRKAVAVVNRGSTSIPSVSLALSDLYMQASHPYTCRDLWSKNETEVRDTLSIGPLKAFETRVYLLTDPASTTSIRTTYSPHQRRSVYDLAGRKASDSPAHAGLVVSQGTKFMRR